MNEKHQKQTAQLLTLSSQGAIAWSSFQVVGRGTG